MHRHLKPEDWALAFGRPDHTEGARLFGCPSCAVARGDLETWILAVAECSRCGPAFEAYQPMPPEVLDCDACMAAYSEFELWMERIEHFEPLVAAEWRATATVVADLIALPEEVQVRRVQHDDELLLWSVCQRLLDESKRRWLTDPLHAHQLAGMATAVADRLDDAEYHPRWVADLRAKAHAYLANTHRILGSYRASEEAFAKAERWVERGTGQGRAEIRVLSLKASLLLDQYRHLESEALLDRVEQHLRAFHQTQELAKVLIKRGRVSAARDMPQQAVHRVQEALELIDSQTDPLLHELAHVHLTQYRLDGGDVAGARSAFERLPVPDDRLVAVRRKWLEANLLRAEENLPEAGRLYDDARIALLADGLHYDVALISLDLAIVARLQGDHGTVRELARDALVLLTRAGASQEAFAAIRLLVDAVEQQAVSTAFIRRIARNLARVQPAR